MSARFWEHPDPPPRPLHAVVPLGPHQCRSCNIRFRCHPNSRARYCPSCVAGRADIVRIVVLLAALVVIVGLILWAGTAVSDG